MARGTLYSVFVLSNVLVGCPVVCTPYMALKCHSSLCLLHQSNYESV